jgi:transposase
MVNLLAAKQCREAGQSVKRIAASAQVSERTVYRWLKLWRQP